MSMMITVTMIISIALTSGEVAGLGTWAPGSV